MADVMETDTCSNPDSGMEFRKACFIRRLANVAMLASFVWTLYLFSVLTTYMKRRPSPEIRRQDWHPRDVDGNQVMVVQRLQDWSLDQQPDSRGFLVDTAGCRIPDYDPYDRTIIEHIEIDRDEPIDCRRRGNRTVMAFSVENEVVVRNLPPKSYCECGAIYRDEMDDTGYADDKTIRFRNRVAVDEEFVEIACFDEDDQEIYRDFFWNFDFKNNGTEPENGIRLESDLSVLIIGIDSTSRLNRIRTLPKTSKYVEDVMGAIQLNGYTKVADNTYPNLVALLTGSHEEELPNCRSNGPEHLDDCPYIWNEFSERGYVTLLAEDKPELGAFNLDRPGFRSKPVDHYFRPLMYSAARTRNGFCIGDRSETKFVLDYTKDFLIKHKDRKFFGLTWMTALSHDNINTLKRVDGEILGFFEYLVHNRIFDSTLIFFISDHGSRTAEIRQTRIGRHEDSLPFCYVIVPPSFRERRPSVVNSRRLTTPFDLHRTLTDHLNGVDSPEVTSEHGLSLFREIPRDRDCSVANIPLLYCACLPKRRRLLAMHKMAAADVLVEFVNRELETFRDVCVPLTLESIQDDDGGGGGGGGQEYFDETSATIDVRTRVRVSPSEAVLEAVVRLRHSPDDVNQILNGSVADRRINRIDPYGTQSWCVRNVFLKLFCYCRHRQP